MKDKLFFLILSLLMFFGCRENEATQQIDDETFLKNLGTAPVSIVPDKVLPEWLQNEIEAFKGESTSFDFFLPPPAKPFMSLCTC